MGTKINKFFTWYRYTPRLQDVGTGGILIAVTQGTWLGITTILQPYQGTMKVVPSPSELILKKKIIGIGNIKIDSSPLIENVVLVDGLKHNLLSISQICDRGFKVVFDDLSWKFLIDKPMHVWFS